MPAKRWSNPRDDPDVVLGPNKPHWGCPSCGRDNNWACRIKCACGKAAPTTVRHKADAAAAEAKRANNQQQQRPNQQAEGKGAGQLKRQLEEANRELAKLRKEITTTNDEGEPPAPEGEEA